MDFWKGLIDIVAYVWPFTRVDHWERGVRYWCGHAGKVVGPGVYFTLPWFAEVRTASTVEFIMGTGRLDLALKDGTILSYAATATAHIEDVFKALNAVNEYQETAVEAFMSACSAQLGKETVASFEPASRAWMLKRIQTAVQEKIGKYGMVVDEVSFVSLVPNARIHRLVMDQMQQISF
jgi:hypothetical protein